MLRLCDRFHCLPSQALAEDVSAVRLLRIEELGVAREDGDHDQYG